MPNLDIFNQDAFALQSMSARVNQMPFVPGQIGESGLFQSDGIYTTSLSIESIDGSLSLVEPTVRGGAGQTFKSDNRALRMIPVPHFQSDDRVTADEVQNIRAFGTESDLETVQTRVDDKMARHFRNLDATTEHQRVGAIKGLVKTASGATTVDLYALFGIAAIAPITWDLASDAFKPRQAAFAVKNQIEDELDATNYSGIRAFCGADFFGKLIENKFVRETYLATAAASDLRNAIADVFTFGGITWERYRTGKKAKGANGGTDFIDAGEARLVATGVPDLFITRYAPADYMETVNSKGLPRYAHQFMSENGKSVNLEMQTNVISICTQPRTLIKLQVA